MSRRRVSRRRLTKISIGDMRECISLETRTTLPPQFGQNTFTETYTVLDEVFAKVETLEDQLGERNDYDGVNITNLATHKFTFRYLENVSKYSTYIRYNGELYRIEGIADPEERHEYLIVRARLKGSDNLEANQ